MIIIWILILCIICGAFFAYLAVRLTMTKGNRISDILNSDKFANAEAIRLQILGKVKLSSNIPIVALFVIAAAVAIVLPAMISWKLMQNVPVIMLCGNVEVEHGKSVYAVMEDAKVLPSGFFQIPIVYTDEPQNISLQGTYYEPVTLSVQLNKLRNSMSVTTDGLQTENLTIMPGATSVKYNKPICLVPGSIPQDVPNEPSSTNPVDSIFNDIEPPKGR